LNLFNINLFNIGERILPLTEYGAKILQELGLTFLQAKVYLALIRLQGDSSVKTISTTSNVARQDVYQTLTDLQEISLIEKVINNPSTFRAIPIQETVAILAERKNQKTIALQAKAIEVFQTIAKIEAEHIQQKNHKFVLIPKKEALINRTKKAFENAQQNVLATSPWQHVVQWSFLLDESVKNCLDRGVKIRWITNTPTDAKAFRIKMRSLLKERNFKLKIKSNNLAIRYRIYDDNDVILAIATSPNAGGSPALVTTNPLIVEMLKDHFEMNWKLAKDFKSLGKLSAIQ